MSRRIGWAAMAAIVIAAGAIILSHLRMPCRDTVYRISASGVSAAMSRNIPAAAADGTVDINRAGVHELESLSGIGPVLAQRIIDERTQKAVFTIPRICWRSTALA